MRRPRLTLSGRRLASAWEHQRAVLSTPAGGWIAALLAVLGVGTAVALVALWPHGSSLQSGTLVVSSRDIEAVSGRAQNRGTSCSLGHASTSRQGPRLRR